MLTSFLLSWILFFNIPFSGAVQSSDGVPLAGATIQFFQENSPVAQYSTVTDRRGDFNLVVAPGIYTIEIRFLGYETLRQQIEVTTAVEAKFILRAGILYGGEVVAETRRARKTLTPITYSNITARELEVLPSMQDLPAALARSVSITHYSENGNDLGYSYLRLRGFGQRRVAVSINGIPQNDPEEHNVFWINFFDLQGSIQDIQIQRGAGAAAYGSTGIGGAINIITDPYLSTTDVRLETGYGSYNTQRYTAQANTGLLGDRYAVYARVSRLTSDGYRDWSWAEFWRYFVGVRRYGEQHTWTLQSYGGPQKDGLAYVGIPKAANIETVDDGFGGTIDRRYNFSQVTRDIERFHQPHVQLLHSYTPSSNQTFQQAFFWIRGIGEFDFGGTFRSADYLRLPANWRGLSVSERLDPLFVSAPDATVLFRATLDQWQVGWTPRYQVVRSSSETTLGGELRLHRSLRWGRVEESAGLPAEVIGVENDYRVYSVRGEKWISSLYASHLIRPHRRLAVQADLQLTWRQYRLLEEQFFGNSFRIPYLFVNPRVGVTLNPEQPLSAYMSISLANREPRMKSLYDGEEAGAGFLPQFELQSDGSFDYDNPIVKPERLIDFELGGQYERQSLKLRLSAYWMEFRDEIVPSGGLDQFGVPRTGNADRTRHIGIELEAAARILPRLNAFANATFSRNRLIKFVEYVTLPDFSIAPIDRAGNPIAGFPARSGNLGLTYEYEGLTLRADARLAGKQYVDNGGGRDATGAKNDNFQVDPYALVSATVQWEFGDRSTLSGLMFSLDVNNVLDSKVLLYGNAGFGDPQFFPAATRHLFLRVQYQLW
ncbi:MAG: TonB-dependent receptor [Bacteroidetes bacterium]|nr:TonB-dependent receptor [Bacteroidota bacterium]MCY4205304.1 TonB-dependent receptor [Bacteroidota bacterium]